MKGKDIKGDKRKKNRFYETEIEKRLLTSERRALCLAHRSGLWHHDRNQDRLLSPSPHPPHCTGRQ